MNCCGGGNAGGSAHDGHGGHEKHASGGGNEEGKTNWVQLIAVLLIVLFVFGLVARFFL